MIRFANGWLFLLLWLNLLIFYVWRKSRPAAIVFPTLARAQAASARRSLRSKLRIGLTVLRIIAFTFIVVALARPQSLARVEQIKTDVIDVIITLDTSLSMGAQDFETGTRLTVAKEMIGQFVDNRRGDRLGLITFAAYSQLRCPLTLDHEILKTLLGDVDLVDRNDQEANGTAIGVALASSVDHLRAADAKSRIVVLLTDGDNNITTIEPQTAAEIARVIGIKVYTIGVGTTGMVAMPSLNPMDPAGAYTMQRSSFNEEVLSQISDATGGKYYRAKDRQSLESIFNEIGALERTEVEVKRYDRYQELFQSWVIAAIIAMLAELLLQHTYLRTLP